MLDDGDEVFFNILFLDHGGDLSGDLRDLINIGETRVGVGESERIDLINDGDIDTATVEEGIESFSSSVGGIQELRDGDLFSFSLINHLLNVVSEEGSSSEALF